MVAIAGIAIGALGLISSIMSASNNAEAAKYAVDKQIAIANRIQARENSLFTLWESEYLGCELMYAAEVCSDRSLVVDLNTATTRAMVTVKRQFARMSRDAINCLPNYCVGAELGIRRTTRLAEASAGAWASLTARRNAEEKVLARNQQIRENKWRVAMQGHGAYFNTAGSQIAADTFGKRAAAHERAAGEASRAAGYYAQQVGSGLRQLGGPGRPDPILDQRPQAPADLAGRTTVISNNIMLPDNTRREESDFVPTLFSDDEVG